MMIIIISIVPGLVSWNDHGDMSGTNKASHTQRKPRTVSTMASAPALRSMAISWYSGDSDQRSEAVTSAEIHAAR